MLLTGHGASRVREVTIPSIPTNRFFYEESGVNAAGLMLELLEKAGYSGQRNKIGVQDFRKRVYKHSISDNSIGRKLDIREDISDIGGIRIDFPVLRVKRLHFCLLHFGAMQALVELLGISRLWTAAAGESGQKMTEPSPNQCA